LVPYCLSAALGGEFVYLQARVWGKKLWNKIAY